MAARTTPGRASTPPGPFVRVGAVSHHRHADIVAVHRACMDGITLAGDCGGVPGTDGASSHRATCVETETTAVVRFPSPRGRGQLEQITSRSHPTPESSASQFSNAPDSGAQGVLVDAARGPVMPFSLVAMESREILRSVSGRA